MEYQHDKLASDSLPAIYNNTRAHTRCIISTARFIRVHFIVTLLAFLSYVLFVFLSICKNYPIQTSKVYFYISFALILKSLVQMTKYTSSMCTWLYGHVPNLYTDRRIIFCSYRQSYISKLFLTVISKSVCNVSFILFRCILTVLIVKYHTIFNV